MCLVFKGGTIGITGYGVIASQIGNLSGRISNFSICKVQDVTGHFVQDIFRLVVNGAAFRFVGDILGTQAAVAGYGRGLVSAYLGIQVGFVVFCDFAGDGGSLITANGVDLVAGNAVGLLAG
ncbi:hypothetical protein, partial [Mitsuokella multacida]|uniref:hypothetical protein n=1 Tax=Mitsuokella multacida TaxID=52226 RepID=UPI0022E2E151